MDTPIYRGTPTCNDIHIYIYICIGLPVFIWGTLYRYMYIRIFLYMGSPLGVPYTHLKTTTNICINTSIYTCVGEPLYKDIRVHICM